MKRTAYMEYAMNDQRSHVISREQKARNPVEVGVDITIPMLTAINEHRVAIQVFIDGRVEFTVNGEIVYERKF